MEVSRRAATILALRIVWRSKLMVRFCFIANTPFESTYPTCSTYNMYTTYDTYGQRPRFVWRPRLDSEKRLWVPHLSRSGRDPCGWRSPRPGRGKGGSFCCPFSNFYFLVGQGRAELAGGEGVKGAEAGSEFGGVQLALAVEPAEP